MCKVNKHIEQKKDTRKSDGWYLVPKVSPLKEDCDWTTYRLAGNEGSIPHNFEYDEFKNANIFFLKIILNVTKSAAKFIIFNLCHRRYYYNKKTNDGLSLLITMWGELSYNWNH